jgi:hypothetical protein
MDCSICTNEARPFNRYCKSCHNDYMREWRKTYVMTERTRIQMHASARLHKQMKDYGLKSLPCEVCGSIEKPEGHHEDYDLPLVVRWLCHSHHVAVTRGRLILEPKSPRWMMSQEDIHIYSCSLGVTYDIAWRKLSAFLINKRRAWIAGGRQGTFKSYPIPEAELLNL